MIEFYPLSRKLFALLEPKSVAKMRLDHFNHTVSRVDKRLKEGSPKPDLWNLVEESGVLTSGEVYTNAELFMTAGTETTGKSGHCVTENHGTADSARVNSIFAYRYHLLSAQKPRQIEDLDR